MLLVDADDQETAADFTAARKQDHPDAASFTCTKLTGKSVHTEVQQMAKKYQHVIIDVGSRDPPASGRRSLSRIFFWCHVVPPALIPGRLRSSVPRRWCPCRQPPPKGIHLSQSHRPAGAGDSNQEAAEHLKTIESLIYLDAQLGGRKAFAHAASQGLAVTELTGKHHNAKAAEEMMALYDQCLDSQETSIQPIRAKDNVMAIRQKPKQSPPASVESFINQGGTVADTAAKPSGDMYQPTRKPAGKRSNPEYKGRYLLIHEPTYEAIEEKLRRDHKGTDVSDLTNALYQKWLGT